MLVAVCPSIPYQPEGTLPPAPTPRHGAAISLVPRRRSRQKTRSTAPCLSRVYLREPCRPLPHGRKEEENGTPDLASPATPTPSIASMDVLAWQRQRSAMKPRVSAAPSKSNPIRLVCSHASPHPSTPHHHHHRPGPTENLDLNCENKKQRCTQ